MFMFMLMSMFMFMIMIVFMYACVWVTCVWVTRAQELLLDDHEGANGTLFRSLPKNWVYRRIPHCRSASLRSLPAVTACHYHLPCACCPVLPPSAAHPLPPSAAHPYCPRCHAVRAACHRCSISPFCSADHRRYRQILKMQDKEDEEGHLRRHIDFLGYPG
jgi:hypothetical protein